MNNSSKFFANKDCEYYPCHKMEGDMNCLFCYCPMYHLESCPGNPEYKEKNGSLIKSCLNCTFPHKAENYDKVMEVLKSRK